MGTSRHACPICRRTRCIWVDLKGDLKRVTTEKITSVIKHNHGYIDMICRDGKVGAASEERMYSALSYLSDEIERRKLSDEKTRKGS